MATLTEEQKVERALARLRMEALAAQAEHERNEAKRREWKANGTCLTREELAAGVHCRGCGKDAERHAAALVLAFSPDHVVPWHRGGSDDADNLVTSCGTCNFMKGSCTIEELRLADPRDLPPTVDGWTGLSAFR